ncbi:GAF domain-containing protein [Flavobacterium sp. MK4S-17]|uniref:GAF domain-containing protein n=1 Tax=Flavobacterium sp. MK4S-17 TaxID=2543737 RepID=UPI001359EDFC|nr:GAF domain-containing protein [Flavobacterium sp. MK4S-17]
MKEQDKKLNKPHFQQQEIPKTAEEELRERESWLKGQQLAFQKALSGKSLPASLKPLVDTIVKQTGGEAKAGFYIIPPQAKDLYHVIGMPEEYAHDVNGFKVGPESVACGLAMHTGEPVITYDVELEPGWEPYRKLAQKHGYRACWAFPVRADGGPVLGTLAMYWAEPRYPESMHLEMAGILAHAAAIIISRDTELAERTYAQAALKENEKRLTSIFASAAVGLSEISKEGKFIRVNETLCTILGRSREELLNSYITQVTAPEYINPSFEAVSRLFETGIPVSLDKQYIRPDGTRVWANSTLSMLNEKCMIVVTADLTDRKRTEIKLQQTQQKLLQELKDTKYLQDRLINTSNINTIFSDILDAAIAIMKSDMGSLQLYVSEKEVLELLTWKGFHPESAEYWSKVDTDSQSTCGKALKMGERIVIKNVYQFEFEDNTSDYHYYRLSGITTVQSTPLLSREGRLLGMLSTHWKKEHSPTEREFSLLDLLARQAADIIDKRMAEEALRNSEQKYLVQLEREVSERTEELKLSKELLQATLDSSLDMIQVFKAVRDENGKITDFIWILNNHASEQLYGDVIGKSLIENNPGVLKTGIFSHFVEVTETGVPQQYEKHYVHEQFNGWFYQSVVKLDDGVATATTDITERKMAEKEVIELNKLLLSKNRMLESLNSELTTFNTIAAKDYRDAFKILYTNLEHIIKTDAAKLSNAGRGNIRKTQSALQKLKLLTEDIVSYSRIPELDKELTEVNLNEVFATTLNDLAAKIQEKGAEIAITAKLPVIQGFPLLLALLFYHLLDNALKFNEEGKKPQIVIDFDTVAGTEIHFPKQDFYKISFTDNGIGFGSKHRLKLFEIFYQVNEKQYKGSGIGLAICKKIMELHEGYITAGGTEGNGAVFCCYFPVDK